MYSTYCTVYTCTVWWHHQMETYSVLLAFVRGTTVTGGFPSQRPVAVTQSFDVYFDLLLDKSLSKQSRRRWFETPWRSLWRHCNGVSIITVFVCLIICFCSNSHRSHGQARWFINSLIPGSFLVHNYKNAPKSFFIFQDLRKVEWPYVRQCLFVTLSEWK